MPPKGVKRGRYADKPREDVVTPTTPEAYGVLTKLIQKTQRQVKNATSAAAQDRAQAYLSELEEARAQYRQAAPPRAIREEAADDQLRFVKQAKKVQRELSKLSDMGVGGFQLAFESNPDASSSSERAARLDDAQADRRDAEQQSTDADAEVARIEAEQQALREQQSAALDAIDKGSATPPGSRGVVKEEEEKEAPPSPSDRSGQPDAEGMEAPPSPSVRPGQPGAEEQEEAVHEAEEEKVVAAGDESAAPAKSGKASAPSPDATFHLYGKTAVGVSEIFVRRYFGQFGYLSVEKTRSGVWKLWTTDPHVAEAVCPSTDDHRVHCIRSSYNFRDHASVFVAVHEVPSLDELETLYKRVASERQ